MALKKIYHVPKDQISNLFSKGRRKNSFLFTVISKEGKNDNNFRLAVILGKKINKRATVRNKIRRIIYSAVDRIEKEGGIEKTDFLILPKKAILSKNQKEILEELQNILSHAKNTAS